MIYSFGKFINLLNEGLIKTTDGKFFTQKCGIFLNPLKIIYNIKYNDLDNTIELEIDWFNKINNLSNIFDCIESLFINMNGWFPSSMEITDLSGMKNTLTYDRNYLLDRSMYFKNIKIKFESKFDIKKDIPNKLFHLTIKQFENQIKKSGLHPKNKSKLTIHPDRIYLCPSLEDCKLLIPQMKSFYSSKKWGNSKFTINDKWIIYEIETKELNIILYSDPNYKNGYYTLDNIPPDKIKIIEKE